MPLRGNGFMLSLGLIAPKRPLPRILSQVDILLRRGGSVTDDLRTTLLQTGLSDSRFDPSCGCRQAGQMACSPHGWLRRRCRAGLNGCSEVELFAGDRTGGEVFAVWPIFLQQPWLNSVMLCDSAAFGGVLVVPEAW